MTKMLRADVDVGSRKIQRTRVVVERAVPFALSWKSSGERGVLGDDVMQRGLTVLGGEMRE